MSLSLLDMALAEAKAAPILSQENVPTFPRTQMSVLSALLVPVKSDTTGQGAQIKVVLRSTSVPDAAPVYHRFGLPGEGDDEFVRNQKRLRLRVFCEAFQIPLNIAEQLTPDPEGKTAGGYQCGTFTSWTGKIGWAVLRVDDDAQFGRRNEVQNFAAPSPMDEDDD